jgi:hypothetical protein
LSVNSTSTDAGDEENRRAGRERELDEALAPVPFQPIRLASVEP